MVGSSDPIGGYPASDAQRPENMASTIYHALGIPQTAAWHDGTDRPHHLYLGDPIAGLFNRITKYVASRSNPTLSWQNSELLGMDVVASLKALKAGDGPDLLVQGSSGLLQTLWKNNLVDEFSVLIFPVVLGAGKRLFGDGVMPAGLRLLKSQSYPTGVIVANYAPAGEVKVGDFQLSEPSEAELERRRKLT